MLQYILLGLLKYAPLTGYALKSIIDESTTHFWHAHHSQIYTMLRKLEEDGLVRSEDKSDDDKLNRRVYHITHDGETVWQQWIERQLTEVPAQKNDLLVKVFFSGRRDPADVLDELRLQKVLHQRQLEFFTTFTSDHIVKRIAAQSDVPANITADMMFWRATLRFGIQYQQLCIDWLQSLIQEIESTL